MAENAANALKLGPAKALELKIIDGIIGEPPAGAHRDKEEAAENIRKELKAEIKALQKLSSSNLIKKRHEKFRNMGNSTIHNLSEESECHSNP